MLHFTNPPVGGVWRDTLFGWSMPACDVTGAMFVSGFGMDGQYNKAFRVNRGPLFAKRRLHHMYELV